MRTMRVGPNPLVAAVVSLALVAGCTSGDDDSGREATPEAGPPEASSCPDVTFLGCPLRRSSATIPILGTALSLEYRSDRAPGRVVAPRDDARRLGLGGWVLDVQNDFDPDTSLLHTGAGETRTVEAIAVGDTLLVASRNGATVDEFTSDGLHTATLDALAGATLHRFDHDDHGRLVSAVDRNGRTLAIERDDEGRPVALVVEGGIRTQLVLDDDGWLTAVRDPIGRSTTMQYGDGGLLLSVTAGAGGGTSTFTYDSDGRLASAVDPSGRTLTYDGPDDGPGADVTMTASEGRTFRWAVSGTDDGLRIEMTEGGATWSEAIADGVHHVTAPDGSELRLAIAGDPRFGSQVPVVDQLTSIRPDGTSREVTTTYEADLDDPSDPRTTATMAMRVSAAGLTTSTRWDRASSTLTTIDAAGLERATTLDGRAGVVAVTEPGRAPFTIEYDEQGRPVATASGDRRTTIAWDDEVGEAIVTDPAGGVTRLAADVGGLLSAVVRPDGSRVSIERSDGGDPVAVRVDGVQVLTQSWSATGDLVATGAGAGLDLDTRTVDSTGRTSAIEAGGQRIVPRYEDGLLSGLELPDGAWVFHRDGTTGAVTGVEDTSTGLATQMIVEDGSVVGLRRTGVVEADLTWSLDEAGRIDRTVVTAADEESAVEYRYDDAGRLVGAGDLTIGYDDSGLAAVTTIGTLRSERDVDEHGQLVAERYETDAGPVYEATYAYDLLGRMTARSVSYDGAPPVQTTYDYDAAGNLVEAAVDGVATYAYAYDGLDRLTSITTPQGTEAVTYDAAGRVATRGDTAYTWSPSGTLRSLTTPDGTIQVQSDAFGRLAGAIGLDGTESTYVLDDDGNVAATNTGGESQRFVYDEQDRLVAELGPDGRIIRRYVYDGGPYAAYVITDRGTYRIIRDAAGNPIAVVDVATGQRVETIDYDPLGRETRVGEAVVPLGYGDALPAPLVPIQLPSKIEWPYDPGAGVPATNTAPWPGLAPGGTGPRAPGGAGSTHGAGSGGSLTGGIGGPASVPSGLLGGPLPQLPSAPGSSGSGALWGPTVPAYGAIERYVRDVLGSNDFRGYVYEGLGLVSKFAGEGAAALGGDLAAVRVGATGALGSWFGMVGLAESIAELIQDVPKIFDPTVSAEERIGIAIKSAGSIAAILPSFFGIVEAAVAGLGFGELAMPIVFEALAWAAVAAGILYLAYQLGLLAGAWGDPHLTTVDGRTYDFQGVGEYVLAREPTGTFEVQARHLAVGDARQVSVIGAIAMRLAGARVTVALAPAGVAIRVDGTPVDLPSGAVALPAGELRRLPDGRIVAQASDGSAAVEIRPYGDRLDTALGAADEGSSLAGLLGPGELRTREGAAVEPAPGDFATPLYAQFGESWRVRPDESLFDYEPGTSTETFTDREYPAAPATLDDLDASTRQRAEELCRQAGVVDDYLDACVLDVAATGDTGYVTSSVRAASTRRLSSAGAGPGAAPGRRDAGDVGLGDELRGDGDPGSRDSYALEVSDDLDGLVVVPADPCGGGTAQLVDPDSGTVLGEALVCLGGRIEVPGAGDYRLDVIVGDTGDYGFTLEAVPEATVEDLDLDDRVDGELDAHGERHVFRFEADAGDAVFVDVPEAGASCDIAVTIDDPGGDRIHSGGACLPQGRILLEETGTYEIAVETVLATGPYSLALLRSSRDERATIDVGDTVDGNLELPGAVDVFEVQAQPGEQLVLRGLTGHCDVSVRPREPGVGFIQGLGFICGELPFTAPPSGRIEIVVQTGTRTTSPYSFRLDRA